LLRWFFKGFIENIQAKSKQPNPIRHFSSWQVVMVHYASIPPKIAFDNPGA